MIENIKKASLEKIKEIGGLKVYDNITSTHLLEGLQGNPNVIDAFPLDSDLLDGFCVAVDFIDGSHTIIYTKEG
jgi:hypothetical protein